MRFAAYRTRGGDGLQVSRYLFSVLLPPAELPCGHAICLQCANSHGFAGQAPYTCPACRQPLSGSEVCEQLLHPSEEWKSVALSGLSPTVVMECAGRALSFWSYQMTNQMSVTPPGQGIAELRLTIGKLIPNAKE